MKRKLLSIAVIGLLAMTAAAQSTNTLPVTDTPATTPPAVVGGLEQVVGVFGGSFPTNINVGPFTTVSTKGRDWAYGIAAMYNLNNNVAFGLVADSIPSRFTLFSGQVTFKADLYPLKWTGWNWGQSWYVSPFIFSQLGSPLGNASSGDTGSGVCLAAGAGANVPLASLKLFGKPAKFCVAGWYETLSGAGQYSGQRIGICPNFHFEF